MYNQCRGLEIRLWDFSIADYQVGCMCPFHFGSSTISEKIMEKGCRSSHGKYRGFPPYNRERRYLSAFIRLSLEKLVCGHGGWTGGIDESDVHRSIKPIWAVVKRKSEKLQLTYHLLSRWWWDHDSYLIQCFPRIFNKKETLIQIVFLLYENS